MSHTRNLERDADLTHERAKWQKKEPGVMLRSKMKKWQAWQQYFWLRKGEKSVMEAAGVLGWWVLQWPGSSWGHEPVVVSGQEGRTFQRDVQLACFLCVFHLKTESESVCSGWDGLSGGPQQGRAGEGGMVHAGTGCFAGSTSRARHFSREHWLRLVRCCSTARWNCKSYSLLPLRQR